MAPKKSPAKKAPAKKAALPLSEMLAKELAGETPPSEEALSLLLRASLAVGLVQPWSSLQDRHVFAFDSDTGQRWYVIVMGAAGEVFGLQGYRGSAGFALFDDIQNDRLRDSAEFLTRQDLFTIEFVRRADLTPLDRAMLALVSEPIAPGTPLPQVRVSRPQELAWYPNAEDVAEMNDCLFAALLFFEWLAKHPQSNPWAKQGELPWLKNWATNLSAEQIPHPGHPAPQRPAPAKMDERRLNQLLASVPLRKLGHPVEVDVFLLRSAMRDDGRPYFPLMALASDATSGFLFPPVMGGIGQKPEDLLIDCVLGALEASPFRPLEYRVRDEFCRLTLEPISQTFNIPLTLAPLPAIAEARRGIEARMNR